MTSKERFYAAMNYQGVDRLPTYYAGNPVIDRNLMDYFKVNSMNELKDCLGDDFREVWPVYIGPELRTFEDGSREGIFGERYKDISFGVGAYVEAVYLPFADIEDPEELDAFRFPSPDWYDYSTIKEQCEKYKDRVVYIGNPGVPDFINGIARRRGVEQVLVDIAFEDPVYLKLMEKTHEFWYGYVKNCLEAAEGMIDLVWVGDDLGGQEAPLISVEKYKTLFYDKHKAYFDLAHEYGAKVIMHSCGSIRHFIPLFIEMGLDILDVLQVNAKQMDIRGLHKDFYKKIAFSGSISTQTTIAFGTVEDVIAEVELRKELFPDGGMIIAPSNQIQDDTPVEKVIALYNTIGSIEKNK